MKTLLEYINKDTFENSCGQIIFDIDESSLSLLSEECQQLILEGNRIIWHDKERNPLRWGVHSEERLDRSIEDGGDGEHIDEKEIIDMFRYAWDDIMEMHHNGMLKQSEDMDAFTIQCKCYLKEKNRKLYPMGARPANKYLWAVFMVVENIRTMKIDIIIKTLYRGERINHIHKQERIVIANNGYVKQKFIV